MHAEANWARDWLDDPPWQQGVPVGVRLLRSEKGRGEKGCGKRGAGKGAMRETDMNWRTNKSMQIFAEGLRKESMSVGGAH